MGFSAEVLADSTANGVRLTTILATFPRFILAELHTHRLQGPWNTGAQSSNSASSRAIPPERQIERVLKDPFVPMTFGRRVKGMGVGVDLSSVDARDAREAWLFARDRSVQAAQVLIGLDVDKSRINRLLEPFLWHTAIITATDWDNFFYLRAPDGDEWDRDFGAQPEFQMLAIEIRKAMEASEPQKLQSGWWHLPFAREDELSYLCSLREGIHPDYAVDTLQEYESQLVDVCGRRLARVSFDKHTDIEEFSISLHKAGELKMSRHYSPFEHIARPMTSGDLVDFDTHLMIEASAIQTAMSAMELTGATKTSGGYLSMIEYIDPTKVWSGNLRGFIQYRKLIEEQPKRWDDRDRYAAAT